MPRLTLNRPDVLNAVSSRSYQLLDEALGRAADDPDVACVLLTGTARAFTAGVDLTDTELSVEERWAIYDGFMQRLEGLRKPVVVAVNALQFRDEPDDAGRAPAPPMRYSMAAVGLVRAPPGRPCRGHTNHFRLAGRTGRRHRGTGHPRSPSAARWISTKKVHGNLFADGLDRDEGDGHVGMPSTIVVAPAGHRMRATAGRAPGCQRFSKLPRATRPIFEKR